MTPEELMRITAFMLTLQAPRAPARTAPRLAPVEWSAVDPDLRARFVARWMLAQQTTMDCQDAPGIRNPWPPENDPTRVAYDITPSPGRAGVDVHFSIAVDQPLSDDLVCFRNPVLLPNGVGKLADHVTIEGKVVSGHITLPKAGRYDVYVGQPRDGVDDYAILKGWAVEE